MVMAILSGPEIISAVHRQDINIDPFEPGLVNPASVDLRLGKKVAVYERWVDEYHGCEPRTLYATNKVLDVKEPPTMREYEIDEEEGLILQPGILYLMHTDERVCSTKYIPVLDGKSSIGRLGIVIHLTAGYGDPGYDGQYTLEVTAVHPIKVYAGMRFCQMRFHEMVGAFMDYQKTGHYVREGAMGAVASAAHTQFKS